MKQLKDLAGKLDAISQLPDADMAAHGLCIRLAAQKASKISVTLAAINDVTKSGFYVHDHDTVNEIKALLTLLEANL
jgi:hypothetical protein